MSRQRCPQRCLPCNGRGSCLTGLPVVALTAYAGPDDRRRAIEAGCDDFMTKPITVAGFMEKLKGILAGRDGKAR